MNYEALAARITPSSLSHLLDICNPPPLSLSQMASRCSTAVPPQQYILSDLTDKKRRREDADSSSASDSSSAADADSSSASDSSSDSDSDSNSELSLIESLLFEIKSDEYIKDMLLGFKSAAAASVSELNLFEIKSDEYIKDMLLGFKSAAAASVSELNLKTPRSRLIVVTSVRGAVLGRLKFSLDGERFDCTELVGLIPPNVDRVEHMHTDALFILLVANDDAFLRLSNDKFYDRFPCIIMTARGYPDVYTRMFLWKMKMELKLPVLALLDSDPLGVNILSVYGHGSYDDANFTIPDIKWLGFRPSDLDKYKIPKECRLLMEAEDIQAGMDLLKDDFVKKNSGWVNELRLMVQSKEKAEIQALCSRGFRHLTEVYLPMKLQHKDWL